MNRLAPSTVIVLALALAAGCAEGGDGGQAPACRPQCTDRQCGDDGCGGACGECEEGLTCDAESGTCLECQPACDDVECGDDGCGGSCGECGDGWTCNAFIGRCVGGCTPDCDGKTCGSDGCSGSCGECSATKDCVAGQCAAKASCTDGKKNGAEGDVDCGGTCPARCAVGKGCGQPADCASGDCKEGTCQADLTCSNNAKDTGESDVDCGGPCGQCANGKTCFAPSDCTAGGCDGGLCCKANACGECSSTPVETCDGKDNDCDGETDENLGNGDLCPKQGGVCKGAREHCVKGSWTCTTAVYDDWDSDYQSTESLCDGKDNDCDGQTDEPDKCCEPKCDAKQCGDDGCGGQCGSCGSDAYCLADFCRSKGVELWRHEIADGAITSTPVLASNGSAYVTLDNPSRILAVGVVGQIDWTLTAPQGQTYLGLHAGPDGILVVRMDSGIVGLDLGTNFKRWASLEVVDRLAVAKDGTMFGTVTLYGGFSVLAIRKTGGNALWSVELASGAPSTFASTPSIAADGTIYVPAPDGRLYALTAAGKTKWSVQVGALDGQAAAIGADGTIYIGTGLPGKGGGGVLHAIAPDGSPKWTFDGGGNAAAWPVVGPDGTVLFVTRNDLVALTPAGTLKWRVTLDHVIGLPFAVTAEGISVVQDSTDVQAFGPDGAKLWKVAVKGGSPLVLSWSGAALLNVNAGTGQGLRLLDVSSRPGSPWPMFGHDDSQTGLYTDESGVSPW